MKIAELERRAETIYQTRILPNIATIKSRLPSQAALTVQTNPRTGVHQQSASINLVVSQGGAKFYYAIGTWMILRQLVRDGHIKLERYSGASAGAWAAAIAYRDTYDCAIASGYIWRAFYPFWNNPESISRLALYFGGGGFA